MTLRRKLAEIFLHIFSPGLFLMPRDASWCHGFILSPGVISWQMIWGQGHKQQLQKLFWKDWVPNCLRKINNDCRMGGWLIAPDMRRPQDRNSKILPVFGSKSLFKLILGSSGIVLSHCHEINVACGLRGQLKFNWTDWISNTLAITQSESLLWEALALLVCDIYD